MDDNKTVSVEATGRALGIGRELAYRLARTGQLPVPVLRIGRFLRVPRGHLEALLGCPIRDDDEDEAQVGAA